MKRIKTLLLLFGVVSLFSGAASVQGPSGAAKAALISRIVQAYGGQKAEACHSIAFEMDVVLVHPSGNRIRGRIAAKPNMFFLEYDLAPAKYRTGLTGATGWVVNNNDPSKTDTLDSQAASVLRLYSLVYSPYLISYLKANARDVTYRGKSTYRSVACDALQFKVGEVGPVDLFFDAEAHLLKGVKFIYPSGNPAPFELAFDSYFEHDGVKVPRRIDVFRRGEGYRSFTITQVQTCQDISQSVFAPRT